MNKVDQLVANLKTKKRKFYGWDLGIKNTWIRKFNHSFHYIICHLKFLEWLDMNVTYIACLIDTILERLTPLVSQLFSKDVQLLSCSLYHSSLTILSLDFRSFSLLWHMIHSSLLTNCWLILLGLLSHLSPSKNNQR